MVPFAYGSYDYQFQKIQIPKIQNIYSDFSQFTKLSLFTLILFTKILNTGTLFRKMNDYYGKP